MGKGEEQETYSLGEMTRQMYRVQCGFVTQWMSWLFKPLLLCGQVVLYISAVIVNSRPQQFFALPPEACANVHSVKWPGDSRGAGGGRRERRAMEGFKRRGRGTAFE